MLKRILSAVGVVVAGFVVVVSVVYWQLKRVETALNHSSQVDVPFNREIVSVSERTADLEKLVSTSFLSQTRAGVEDHRTRVKEAATRLAASMKRIAAPQFASLHSETITSGDAATGTNSTTTAKTLAPVPVHSFIASLTTNIAELSTIGERTVDLAEEQLQLRQNLEASKEELSKIYRKTFPLAKVDDKAFATLSRAVITTFYSSSTRDLNFVGRTKFKEGHDALTKAIAALPADNKEAKEFKELLDGVAAQFNKTFEHAIAASAAKADWTLFAERAERVKKQFAELRNFTDEDFAEDATELTAKTRRTVVASLWLSVISITVGTSIAFLIARSITRHVTNVAERLRQGAIEVNHASSQMESTSTALSEGASSQAASLEETSASLTEMASMTKQNSSNAQNAKELTVDTRVAAENGSNEIREMEVAMAAIRESSNSIGKIVKSIDEIAFQTNILALNAAVEAARAGEAGLGFAVVADEVRNLAQRSALAARETADKIQDSITKSERGAQLSAKVAQSLQSIVTKTQKVDALVGEIATASREQSDGVALITTAVNRVDKVTQESASSAEESATAAAELRAQAASLCESIEDLARLVGTNTANNTSPSAAPSHTSRQRVTHVTASVSHTPQDSNEPAGHIPLPPLEKPRTTVTRSETPAEATSTNFKDF